MTTTIHLALTHDWELRGDGSGDIEEIQFARMRQLIALYGKHGARTTFLPDVLQQLAFRRYQHEHPELQPLADRWDDHVREAFVAGHDIQLHLHPHWRSARYVEGRWQLDGDWSILNYDREAARAMLAESKAYLENVLRPVDSTYSCEAFRAGALAAAPSDYLFESLLSLGIKLDVSIVAGLFVENPKLQLNYRRCEEGFLPFFPNLKDARRISDKHEPIVCVPLNHFYASRRAVGRQNISLAVRELRRRTSGGSANASDYRPAPLSDPQSAQSSTAKLAYEKLVVPMVKRKHFVSDTGRLNYPLMREMLASIRQRAAASGLAQVPVVLTNHPKDIRDLAAIERFVAEVSQTTDIKFITLRELTRKLQSGEFQIRRVDQEK